MRDIKFRAWSLEQEAMIYPSETGWFEKAYRGSHVALQSVRLDTVISSPYLEPMQYTGLKDNYGKDIYEGDILAFEDEKEFKWLVKYDYDSFIAKGGEHNQEEGLIEFYDWNRNRLDVVVLGNIYENSNLLKEEIR